MTQTAPRRLTLRIEHLEPRHTPAVTWSVSFDDPGKAYAAYYDEIRATLLAAGQEWSRYLHNSSASIQVAVEFKDLGKDIFASAASETSVYLQKNGKLEVWEQSVPYEIRTGKDPNASSMDAGISINPGPLADSFWFDPTPTNRNDETVPYDKEDAYSILLHELGHCLGFDGWRDWTTAKLPSNVESRFDRLVTVAADGTPYFNGPGAMAAYGNQPVPLTYSDLYHVGNDTYDTEDGNGKGHPGDDLMDDLMSGTGLDWGTRTTISALDIGVLHDIGLPIWNDPPTVAAVADQFISTGSGAQLSLSVSDAQTPSSELRIWAESSNPDLIRSDGMYFARAGSDENLTISPLPGAEGAASITIHASDGIVETAQSFNVRVADNPFPWRNGSLRWDVNNDSVVAPNDVLVAINHINEGGAGPLPWREPRAATAPFYDVHADNILAPNDILEVINYINDQTKQLSAATGGEGEQASDLALWLILTDMPGAGQIAKSKSVTIIGPAQNDSFPMLQ
jgi:hypothetical protein